MTYTVGPYENWSHADEWRDIPAIPSTTICVVSLIYPSDHLPQACPAEHHIVKVSYFASQDEQDAFPDDSKWWRKPMCFQHGPECPAPLWMG